MGVTFLALSSNVFQDAGVAVGSNVSNAFSYYETLNSKFYDLYIGSSTQ